MAEIALAITGLTLQGLQLHEKIDKCRKDGKEANFRIQHIQGSLRSINSMLAELKSLLDSLVSSEAPTTPKLRQDITNFQHEIAMIEDAFTSLEILIEKYDATGSDAPVLQAGRFTAPPKLSSKQKFKWAKDDLKQAEKLGTLLAGHLANLSFAVQIMNT